MPSTASRRRLVIIINNLYRNYLTYLQEQEDQESEDQQPQHTQRRRIAHRYEDGDNDDEDVEEEDDTIMGLDGDEDSQEQLVKKLVRYALACEFQRLPIRRSGITEKGGFAIVSRGVAAYKCSDW